MPKVTGCRPPRGSEIIDYNNYNFKTICIVNITGVNCKLVLNVNNYNNLTRM